MSLPLYTETFHRTTYSDISPLLPALSASNRTVLITGGGSGLGGHIAQSFALAGSTQIVLLGRTQSSLLDTKKEIEKSFPETTVLTFVADITDVAAVQLAFTETEKTFRAIDVLVLNAGYLPNIEPVLNANIDEYMKGFDVNIRGALIVSQAYLHSLANTTKFSSNNSTNNLTKEPIIINISTAGTHGPTMGSGFGSYAASKLAALKVMEYLAFENPSVRVMNVHPGVVDTEMNKKATKGGLQLEFDDVSLTADFIVWAASPAAAFLRNKFIWSNWDVKELVAKKEELEASSQLTIGLLGWS